MPSFTTIFRAIVMVAAGIVVVKGWQLYGLSTEQVKSAVVNCLDLAQSTRNGQPPPGDGAGPTAGELTTAPHFDSSTQPPVVDVLPPPVPALAQSPASRPLAGEPPLVPNPPIQESITSAAEPTSNHSTTNDSRLTALMSRLEQLGAAEPKLAPWGSGGNLYRFCCRAAPANSPSYARHFESVATEPELAVEQVVAKVEAWRNAQRDDLAQRY